MDECFEVLEDATVILSLNAGDTGDACVKKRYRDDDLLQPCSEIPV